MIKDINELPEKPGIYLLVQIIRDLEDNNSYYAIKVGKSSNLRKRVKSYKGMNPGCACIDFFSCYNYSEQEEKFHNKIMQAGGYCCGGNEWFSISKENFNKILKNGLNEVYNLRKAY